MELQEKHGGDKPAAVAGRGTARGIVDGFKHQVAFELQVMVHIPIDADGRRVVGIGRQQRSGRIRERIGGGRHGEPQLFGAHGQLDRAIAALEQIASRIETAVFVLAGQSPRPGDVPGAGIDAGQIGAAETHAAALFGDRDVFG